MLSLSYESQAEVDTLISECQGCHTDNRIVVEERFSNGFGKWTDAQCFGCHQEITQIAVKFNSGEKDKRYFSLPVSDTKLKLIGHHALSYLNAPLNPVRHSAKRERFDRVSLEGFLKRPFGKCDQSGSCQAPTMMAYPKLSKQSLDHFAQWLAPSTKSSSNNVTPSDDATATLVGETVFERKCAACHRDSVVSGYNTVGLSLFSERWLFKYANKLSTTDTPERNMPTVAITKAEATQLAAFFNIERANQERQLDNSLRDIPTIFKQDESSPLSKGERFYLWKRLWRDNSCVHCHGIEGRANRAFDTSEAGITRWVTNNDPLDLYARLVIRKKESQFGIGAKLPGMPMTKAPVPKQVSSLISRWIKNGCVDLHNEVLCKNNKLNNKKVK
ncbi:cytochrome c [Pseudoalteromonas ulvae]|uniref:cytochrome c n=1 Tax=Pseudoalteromonas ulvae TaxID=107327 RepID=UPI001120F778|nr:cytochrome c [Pseudoalteromonas ulvae]